MADALLLDTCALLWLASGSRSLSKAARSAIAEAQRACVSPVTAWEIAVKVSKVRRPHDMLAVADEHPRPLPRAAWCHLVPACGRWVGVV